MADLQLGPSLRSVVEQRSGFTSVALSGVINEAADFAPLTRITGPLVLDLSKLDRINSLGVRTWMDFVRTCEKAGTSLTFERCAPIMVGQTSMITNFMGTRSRVKSILIPYLCTSCQNEHVELLELAPGAQVRTSMPCPKCNASMVLDDVIETYSVLVP